MNQNVNEGMAGGRRYRRLPHLHKAYSRLFTIINYGSYVGINRQQSDCWNVSNQSVDRLFEDGIILNTLFVRLVGRRTDNE